MSEKKLEFNENHFAQQLIITGMANLVDEGYTTRQVMELLRQIKNNTFHALLELEKENKTK